MGNGDRICRTALLTPQTRCKEQVSIPLDNINATRRLLYICMSRATEGHRGLETGAISHGAERHRDATAIAAHERSGAFVHVSAHPER
jgi:hypothetical protein